MELITVSFFIWVYAIEMQLKQHGTVRQINSFTLQWINNNQGTTWCIIRQVIYGIFSYKPVFLYIISIVELIFVGGGGTCSNFILWELIFVDCEKNPQNLPKLEPAKI